MPGSVLIYNIYIFFTRYKIISLCNLYTISIIYT